MKTKVTIIVNGQYNDFKIGEEGYIDGYCRGGDDRAYAMVVISDRIVMAPLHCLKVIDNQ